MQSPGAAGSHFTRENGAVGATGVPGCPSYSSLFPQPKPGPAAPLVPGPLVLSGPDVGAGRAADLGSARSLPAQRDQETHGS